MKLFANDPGANLLPFDGSVHYHGPIFNAESAQRFFDTLLTTIPWRNDESIIYGKHFVTARKVAWFGDENYSYAYSGKTRTALPWTPALLDLRQTIQARVGAVFNSCLLNLYHSGDEGMGWHSDDERSLVSGHPIASVSFGAERKFSFRHKRSAETVSVLLENGSLLVMAGTTQNCWQHSIPKTKRVTSPRINLTFRSIAASGGR